MWTVQNCSFPQIVLIGCTSESECSVPRNQGIIPLPQIHWLRTGDIELNWTALEGASSATLAMTSKTIPAYLEEERQKDRDAQLRMEEEAARIQHLHPGHHRTRKQPKLELPSAVKAVPKTRKPAAAARKKPRTAREKRRRPARRYEPCARARHGGLHGLAFCPSHLERPVC